MVSEAQAEYVNALLQERHNKVRQDFDALLNALAQAERDKVQRANENLKSSLDGLKSVVSQSHWPIWLRNISKNVERYSNNHSNGLGTWRAHLDSILSYSTDLNNESWHFEQIESYIFDVDDIAEKVSSENEIPELYDRIIIFLDEILKSEEIDSLNAISDLEKILSTLKRAKKGSFASQVFTWNFARRLIPNILSSYVKKSPTLGSIIEGFEQTATELDVSLADAKDKIGQRIIDAAASAMRTDTAIDFHQVPALTIENKPAAAGEIDEKR